MTGDLMPESSLGVVLYQGGLFLGGLIAAFLAFRNLPKQSRLGFPGTTPWLISKADFLLFVALFILWYIASSHLSLTMMERMQTEEDPTPILAAALGNFILHVGLIFLFWRWRESHRDPAEARLNRAPLTLPAALGQGLFYFFASLLCIYGIALGWQSILKLGNRAGLSINLTEQPAVELFRTAASDPVSFLALAFVAVVVAPISEELVFRAGFYRFFSGRMGKISAAVLSGLLFGFLHANLVSFLPLAAFGILLCFIYEVTGNLRVPIFVHAIFNLNTLVLMLLGPSAVPPA